MKIKNYYKRGILDNYIGLGICNIGFGILGYYTMDIIFDVMEKLNKDNLEEKINKE